MLVAKWVKPGGAEEVFEVSADGVKFEPSGKPMNGCTPGKVALVRDDGRSVAITEGSVFVMNESGNTVSRWRLSS